MKKIFIFNKLNKTGISHFNYRRKNRFSCCWFIFNVARMERVKGKSSFAMTFSGFIKLNFDLFFKFSFFKKVLISVGTWFLGKYKFVFIKFSKFFFFFSHINPKKVFCDFWTSNDCLKSSCLILKQFLSCKLKTSPIKSPSCSPGKTIFSIN